MWLVIRCCRDLLFECVKQQHWRFWVITVLQFRKSHHAVLPFLWGVLEFWSCFVVFVPSHKMTTGWVVLGCFGVVLIYCYIRLFLRSFFYSFCLRFCFFVVFFPSPSASSTHTSLWLQPPNQNTWPGYGKERRANDKMQLQVWQLGKCEHSWDTKGAASWQRISIFLTRTE